MVDFEKIRVQSLIIQYSHCTPFFTLTSSLLILISTLQLQSYNPIPLNLVSTLWYNSHNPIPPDSTLESPPFSPTPIIWSLLILISTPLSNTYNPIPPDYNFHLLAPLLYIPLYYSYSISNTTFPNSHAVTLITAIPIPCLYSYSQIITPILHWTHLMTIYRYNLNNKIGWSDLQLMKDTLSKLSSLNINFYWYMEMSNIHVLQNMWH